MQEIDPAEFEKLLDALDDDEEGDGPGDGLAEHPRVAYRVLKALEAHLDTAAEDRRVQVRLRRLFSRYAGEWRERIDDLSRAELEDACRSRLALVQAASEQAPAYRFDVLAEELGTALGLDPADVALAALGLTCLVEPDVARAIDLVHGSDREEDSVLSLLAHVTGFDTTRLYAALTTPSLLRCESLELAARRAPSRCLQLPRNVASLIKSGETSVARIVALFFRLAPKAELGLADFQDQSGVLTILERFIRGAMGRPRPGINVLLHGKPGTGKTQFVRALSESLGARLLEVEVVDADGDPLSPLNRVKSLMACQRAIATGAEGLVMFDEVEDVFPRNDSEFALFPGFGMQRSDRHKGWLTQVLDGNPRPIFWLCNTIRQIDPAYLRRFDLVVEMKGPSRDARKRLVEQVLGSLPLEPARRTELVNDEQLSPAHLQKLAGVLTDINTEDGTDLDLCAAGILKELRAAMGAKAPEVSGGQLRYRADCVRADEDLEALADSIATAGFGRLCLYGPPGTGKSEWVRQLADRCGKTLVVRRASELLGPYVGQTERAIAAAFASADSTNTVLLIDEADSFLRSRERAQHSWEATMVNEFLTCVERHQGICAVTTNFIDELDPACARRFDFKLRFDWLSPDQSVALLQELMVSLDIADTDATALREVRGLERLTPGDFANVGRQNRIRRLNPTPAALVRALAREARLRPGTVTGRRMGFV